MSDAYGCAGNDPVAEEAASDFLLDGGTAVGAALAGYFAAAGAHAGVLLAPATLLVGGLGGGARAFDGRNVQPGLGTKRPRGFKKGEEVPDAARVAVPTVVPALLVAHAYDGADRLAKILKAGIARAQRTGATGRASLLRRVRDVGAQAMTEPTFVRPILREAGPSQGGLITPADFNQVPELDHAAAAKTVAKVKLAVAPWMGDGVDDADGVGCSLCAVDRRGAFAALCYRRVIDGFLIEDLELEAPLTASPVERGKTRVRPGARLPAPTPVALKLVGGRPVEALSTPAAATVDREVVEAPKLAVRRDPKSGAVECVRT